MDLSKIVKQAKKIVDERGGTDALKADASELKDIVSGQGSAADKAKAAFDAIKNPGANKADAAASDENAPNA